MNTSIDTLPQNTEDVICVSDDEEESNDEDGDIVSVSTDDRSQDAALNFSEEGIDYKDMILHGEEKVLEDIENFLNKEINAELDLSNAGTSKPDCSVKNEPVLLFDGDDDDEEEFLGFVEESNDDSKWDFLENTVRQMVKNTGNSFMYQQSSEFKKEEPLSDDDCEPEERSPAVVDVLSGKLMSEFVDTDIESNGGSTILINSDSEDEIIDVVTVDEVEDCLASLRKKNASSSDSQNKDTNSSDPLLKLRQLHKTNRKRFRNKQLEIKSQNERERRERMRQYYHRLQSLLPNIAKCVVPYKSVLTEATSYIQQLEEKEKTLVICKLTLKKTNLFLRNLLLKYEEYLSELL